MSKAPTADYLEDDRIQDAPIEPYSSTDKPYIRPDLGEKLEAKFAGVSLPPPGSHERKALERKLVWKLDLLILPIIWIMYILNYLDRNNIAAAKLSSFMEDLNLTSTKFTLGQTILFAGYIIFLPPSNYIIEKVPYPGAYIATCMALWGALATSICAAKNYQGLAALRFFVGMFEAPFYAGCIYYLSSWYTSKELARRAALYVSGSWVSGAISGLIAWGVQTGLSGKGGRPSWQWLFIIEGALTIFFAAVTVFTLPSRPDNAWQLTKQERLLAVVRLAEDVGRRDDDNDVEDNMAVHRWWKPIVLAVKDIKTWLFIALGFWIAAAASVSTVFPTIVGSLGYSVSKTYIYTMFPWLVVAITSIINSFGADYVLSRSKKNVRWIFAIWGPVLSIIGYIMCVASTDTTVRYVGMFLILQIYNIYSLMFAWASSSLPRPPAKRSQAIALMTIAANVPNIFMPFIFNAPGASPQFYVGFGLCIAYLVLSCVCVLLIVLVLKNLNKKLEAGVHVDGMDPDTGFRFLY